MPQTADGNTPWRRLAGLGFEFFGAVFGLVLLGTWIDRRYGTSPNGVLICAILGILGGLFNLIRSALNTLNRPETPGEARKLGRDRDEGAKVWPVSPKGDDRTD